MSEQTKERQKMKTKSRTPEQALENSIFSKRQVTISRDEHAALVAVAEAADNELSNFLKTLATAPHSSYIPDFIVKDARRLSKKVERALAALAAVREGKAVQS